MLKKFLTIFLFIVITFNLISCDNNDKELPPVSGGNMVKYSICFTPNRTEEKMPFPFIYDKPVESISFVSLKGKDTEKLQCFFEEPIAGTIDIFEYKNYYVNVFGLTVSKGNATQFPIIVEGINLKVNEEEIFYSTPDFIINNYDSIIDDAVFIQPSEIVYQCSVPVTLEGLLHGSISLTLLCKENITIKKYYLFNYLDFKNFNLNGRQNNLDINLSMEKDQQFTVSYDLIYKDGTQDFHIVKTAKVIEYNKPLDNRTYIVIDTNGYTIRNCPHQIKLYIDNSKV